MDKTQGRQAIIAAAIASLAWLPNAAVAKTRSLQAWSLQRVGCGTGCIYKQTLVSPIEQVEHEGKRYARARLKRDEVVNDPITGTETRTFYVWIIAQCSENKVDVRAETNDISKANFTLADSDGNGATRAKSHFGFLCNRHLD